ncbi:hypothetical protein WJX81_005820 [Elliptochloris bilobata]|uniref:protein-histidine N-methyltransferase n=1 Tax=Elliptochloris bilobata TaxID=381761 RepID=A0AAW1SBX2_9CHLO
MSLDAGGFSFNFTGLPGRQSNPKQPPVSNAAPAPAEEVIPDPEAYACCVELETVQVTPDISLLKGRVASHSAAKLLRGGGGDDLAASDLVPGQYEGGFKLWEGGLDLARFLAERWPLSGRAPPGTAPAPHALPGLLALWAGAEVHFQDFNRAVLGAVTARNVAANTDVLAPPAAPCHTLEGLEPNPALARPDPRRARYFAGGWAELPALLEGLGLRGGYDVVLSSETLYCPGSHAALYQCILQSLKPRTGVAYIAAKTYYFGVGGGTAAFRRLVEADGVLTVRSAAVLDDGASVKREILTLAFA